ncbi:leucine-rich repeat domain-containing protein [Candidatus Saccharibacteria bacterium]|nr:leucine-rich repeat domain-containing protein [Candidatus Saccharibacteria bacterium]
MINEINKVNINKNFRVLLLALAFVAVGLVINPSSASAATPPDSCFAFNSGTNTIEDYYDNEDNNGANPACPRDVDIPAAIGGDAVTIIGDSSFAMKNLTAVTIPSSVTDIQRSAFVINQIESVIIPSSISVINSGVFANNKIKTLTLPSSITSIGPSAFGGNYIKSVIMHDNMISLDQTAFIGQSNPGTDVYADLFTSGNAVLAQAAMEKLFFTRVYTASASNPNGLADGSALESAFSNDFNQDGDQDDSMGGHIINPVAVNLSYKDTAGNSLLPDLFQTGSGGLRDYMAKNNPNNELNRYYRLGSQQTFTPPAINGFVTPASASFALDTAPTTNYSFVYQPNAVATSDTSATLADTGDDANTLELLVAVLILAPLATTILYQRNRKHHTA